MPALVCLFYSARTSLFVLLRPACSASALVRRTSLVSTWMAKNAAQVWLHFNLKKDGLAQCNTCEKLVTAKGGCTTNMAKHLRLHGIIIKECTVFNSLRRSPAPVASSTSESDSQPSASNSSLQTESGTWKLWLSYILNRLAEVIDYQLLKLCQICS